MTSQSQPNPLADLLRTALAADPVGGPPHVVDDPGLIERWACGELTTVDRRELLLHLAACAECRAVLDEWVRDDLFKPGEPLIADDDEDDEVPIPAPAAEILAAEIPAAAAPPAAVSPARNITAAAAPARRSPRLPLALLATAAAVLVAVGLYQWSPGSAAALAEIETLLDRGQAAQALAKAEAVLPNLTADADRQRAARLGEQAAERLAFALVERGDLAAALEVAGRAERLGDSDRSRNLALQVERGVAAPLALAMNDRLDRDFGFTLGGTSSQKALPLGGPPTPSPAQSRWLAEYARAVARFPGSVPLRLNYGDLLLRLDRPDDALVQFQAAATADPRSAAAQTGVGLAAFNAGDRKLACEAFRQATVLEPPSVSATLNLAICLEAEGQHAAAVPLWRALLAMPLDNRLRQSIRVRFPNL